VLKIKKILKNNNGFTLPEIMIVIIVMGILLYMSQPVIGSIFDQLKSDVKTLNQKNEEITMLLQGDSTQENDNTTNPDTTVEGVELTGQLMVFNPYVPEGYNNVQPEVGYLVEVYQDGEKITDATTNNEGYYTLDLKPGNYEIPNPYNPEEMLSLPVSEGMTTIPRVEYELTINDFSNYFANGEHYEKNLGKTFQVEEYNLAEWSNIQDIENAAGMFYNAANFNQDLSYWGFYSLTDISAISNMVEGSGLNQINYNRLVEAIYETNPYGWSINQIDNEIGTPITGVSYTGSF